jgi:tRNA A37 threonylcarbamoyladenosine synthetase subunit TsaC/SUA5/YrdC
MYFNLLNAVSYLERSDGVIAIPGLDTYCLAARPAHEQALKRIHRITRREESFLMLGCDQAALEPFWRELPEAGQRLIRKHWPGVLVLALDARENLSATLTAHHKQMKFMMPECGLLQALLAMQPDGALAVCAANRLELPVACTALDVLNSFGEDVDYVLPGDDLVREAVAPTVVSVDAGGEIHLLRSGGIVLD